MTNWFTGAVERVAAAPGTRWNGLAVIVDAGGDASLDDDDGGRARPIGLAAPGDIDCATFRGDALDGRIAIRQLRRSQSDVRLHLERLAVGDAGDSLDRLEVVATVALDAPDRWRGLEHELRMLGAQTADARGGDVIDDRLREVLETALESFVRGSLLTADARDARDGLLAHAILPSGTATLGGSFRLHALRVTRASWAGSSGVADAEPYEGSALEVPTSASAEADESAEASMAEPATVDVALTSEMALALDAALAADTEASGDPARAPDAPLADSLGSSPALAEAWAREASDVGVAAIGAVVHDNEATVLVLHDDPSRVALSSALMSSLGRALNVGAPRVLLMSVTATLRELLTDWLAEQAVPAGVEAAVLVDDERRRVVLELSGADAAGFVERIAHSGAVDLAVLGAVLPWSVSLRAMGDEGLVEADGSGRAFDAAGAGASAILPGANGASPGSTDDRAEEHA